MGLINMTGYFKGTIVGGALGQSTGGFPQEVLAIKATEVYDEEGQEYLPADDEHDEITWYGVLIGKNDKETKNAQQLKKIIDWDGASFVDLHGMNLAGVPLSFRVEENTYDNNTTLQVKWVAEPDASPTRTVSKISKEDAQALQARYAPVLASTKAPVKAVSAKGKGKMATTTKTPPEARVKREKAKRPTTPKITAPVGKCTLDEAYDACYSLKRDDVTEDDLNERWRNLVATYNTDETKITPEECFKIKETLLVAVSKV